MEGPTALRLVASTDAVEADGHLAVLNGHRRDPLAACQLFEIGPRLGPPGQVDLVVRSSL